MSDFSLFLGKFLRHGTNIASLAPSSPWLSKATVGNVDWASAKVIVELGAGTGPITRVIADKASPETRVIVLERDEDFARLLRERFAQYPHFDVIEGDVRDLAAMLSERGIGRVDHVISGLPVPSFPKDLQESLFQVVREVLDPAGTYNQITEIPWVYQGLYRKYFDDVRFVFEPRNFPPAGAYYCRGIKG
ncbi:ornithine lipid N-methyltransferase [Tundrisphaera lichenicola]|uniref:ornithine lipid N-methyltransferase n=1 Tax=Tundrisphaera lichenicola TaxID=2029860 RepID=UPI003EBBB612